MFEQGFCEAVILSNGAETLADNLCFAANWQVSDRGIAEETLAVAWGMGQKKLHWWLLTAPAKDAAAIRIYQAPDVLPGLRNGAHSWDSGGIFDLNLRVRNIDAVLARFLDCGWKAFSQPVEWRFGSSLVREVLVEGPDGVVFALIERLDPPLAANLFGETSGVFNSSQVVADLEAACAFYRGLGFSSVVAHRGPLPGNAGRVLGLASNEFADTDVALEVLHPQGEMAGSVELVTIDKPGRDLRQQVSGEHAGVVALRFPLKPRAAPATLREFGPSVQMQLPPYGEVTLHTLISPDGVRLECFAMAAGEEV